jgi:hypothetical protein
MDVAPRRNCPGAKIGWPARCSLSVHVTANKSRGRTRHQQQRLWWLWAGLPAGRTFHEAAVTAHLKARHPFGDHAILRQSLCDGGLLSRTRTAGSTDAWSAAPRRRRLP